jgi:hypothetical protein
MLFLSMPTILRKNGFRFYFYSNESDHPMFTLRKEMLKAKYGWCPKTNLPTCMALMRAR